MEQLTAKFLAALLISLFAINDCYACIVNNVAHPEIFRKVGQSLYLECVCENPSLSGTKMNTKWFDNHGIEVPEFEQDASVFSVRNGATLALTIKNASRSNSGNFTCVSTYVNGRNRIHTHPITVYNDMYFPNFQFNQFIIKDTDATINCTVHSEDDVLVTWRKEGLEESLDRYSPKYKVIPNALIVKKVNESDSGTYFYSVINTKTGDAVEKSIEVDVAVIPTISNLVAIPNNTVDIGEKLQIECLADGIPTPDYAWKKIPSNANITWQQNGHILLFENVTEDDRGVYECLAKNDVGEIKKQITIEVHTPPEITEFKNVTASEGYPVTITCKARGRPMPQICLYFESEGLDKDPRCYRSGNDITVEESRSMDNELATSLRFEKVQRVHEGPYICNASNSLDYATEVMNLVIQYKPFFEQPEETIWTWSGHVVKLSCKHESNPPANRKWNYVPHTANPLSPDDENRIIVYLQSQGEVITLSKPYYGQYTCKLWNTLGDAEKKIHVRQGFPPPPLSLVSIVNVTATTATFSILPPIYDGPPLTGINAEYDDVEVYAITDIHKNRSWALDRPYKLDKLKPSTRYRVKFAAVNEVGRGSLSQEIEFETLNTSSPEPPQIVYPLELMTPEGWIRYNDTNQQLNIGDAEENGEPIDEYVIKYCPMDNNTEDNCKQLTTGPVKELPLNILELDYNRTYVLEIVAHNKIGNSTPNSIQLINLVSEPTAYPLTLLSASNIIIISVIVVVICIILLDVLLYCTRKQGMIASCCQQKNKKKKKKEDSVESRDKKGLLKDNGESADDTTKRTDNGHKEFEYNKTTGVITGKHSAV